MEKKISIGIFFLILTLTISSIVFAEDIKQAQYTIEIGLPEFTTEIGSELTTSLVWQKGEKRRIEKIREKKQISIERDGFVFSFFPGSKIGFKRKQDRSDYLTNPFKTTISFHEGSIKFVRTEVFRGYPCSLYEQQETGGTQRVWVWKDKNFLIRTETESEGKIIFWIEYKDIKLNIEIDEKLFELPEGVEFTDLSK